MEHELVKHCQDKDAKFYGLTKKDFVLISFKISYLNGLSHKQKSFAGKDWVREFSKTWATCSHSKYCSMRRIIGFNRLQCQNFFLRI